MKTKGFTLVELLVVIAILAILATVSVVGYTSFINDANNSVAMQELTQIRDYALSVDLTEDGNMDGKVSKDEADVAIGAANLGTGVWDTATTPTVVKYTTKDGSGVAYWVIATGEVTTKAPTGVTFPTA